MTNFITDEQDKDIFFSKRSNRFTNTFSLCFYNPTTTTHPLTLYLFLTYRCSHIVFELRNSETMQNQRQFSKKSVTSLLYTTMVMENAIKIFESQMCVRWWMNECGRHRLQTEMEGNEFWLNSF